MREPLDVLSRHCINVYSRQWNSTNGSWTPGCRRVDEGPRQKRASCRPQGEEARVTFHQLAAECIKPIFIGCDAATTTITLDPCAEPDNEARLLPFLRHPPDRVGFGALAVGEEGGSMRRGGKELIDRGGFAVMHPGA